MLQIEGEAWLMHFAAAISSSELAMCIASVRDQEYIVAAALDMLISGY